MSGIDVEVDIWQLELRDGICYTVLVGLSGVGALLNRHVGDNVSLHPGIVSIDVCSSGGVC